MVVVLWIRCLILVGMGVVGVVVDQVLDSGGGCCAVDQVLHSCGDCGALDKG